MSVFVTIGTERCVREIAPEVSNISELLTSLGFHHQVQTHNENEAVITEAFHPSFYVLCNGLKVDGLCKLEDGKSFHIVPRILGGKGGFGSMLRAIGAQIEKTTSREACRDLSGRRMRDINNEKKLKEWLAKEADREKEKEERKQERLARRLAQPQHKFDDAQYHEQRSKVQEDLQDALQKGLKRTKKSDASRLSGSGSSKRQKLASSKDLLGMDIDSDDLETDSDSEEADPGRSSLDDDSNTEANNHTTLLLIPGSSPKNEDNASVEVKEEGLESGAVGNTHCSGDVCGKMDDKDVKIEPVVKEEKVDSNEPVDLQVYTSSSELLALGLDRLKNALTIRGLKCGGTLEERADRLFSVKGLTQEQIDPSLFAKLKGKGKKSK